jgi:hypothetical protein
VTVLSPRDYQIAGLDAITTAWTAGMRRQLLQLPTGLGKTIIFVLLLKQRGGRSLILVHRDELVQQTLDKLALVGLTDVGVVEQGEGHHRQIQVRRWGAVWPEVLGEGLDLGYAQGIGEDYARTHARTLTDRDAPWRREPATEKQLSQFRRFHIPIPLMLTRGQASDTLAPYFVKLRRPA